MQAARRTLFTARYHVNTLTPNQPTETLRRRIMLKEMSRRAKSRKNKFLVPVPESTEYLDTISTPMVLTAVGFVLLARVLLMRHEATEQERLERKIEKASPEEGTVRMVTREEWEEIQELRPRTPFESSFSRANARIRSGDPISIEDVKDWTFDVLNEGLARVEKNAKH